MQLVLRTQVMHLRTSLEMYAPTIMPRAKLVNDKSSATLWALCSLQPHDSFELPWSDIATELWITLGTALESSLDRDVAISAASLGYADCIRQLRRRLPTVHRIMTDIRGLVLASTPEPVSPEKNGRVVPITPGTLLVYASEPWL
jgi:hypothetical protein